MKFRHVFPRASSSRGSRLVVRARSAFDTSLLALLVAMAAGCRPSAAKDEAPCERLAQELCGTFGRPSEACRLVEERVNRFTAARCARGLDAYADEVAALTSYQEGLADLAGPRRRSGTQAPAKGPSTAPVTLVLFSDFECSDCARASPLARTVEGLFGDEVRLVFRQFPQPTHPDANLAAEASLEAEAQGKFWAYHDVLFGNPHDLGRAALERYAALVGLELSDLRAALDQRRHAGEVEEDVEIGRAVFASTPPALFVDGQRVPVPFDTEALTQAIRHARSKGHLLE